MVTVIDPLGTPTPVYNRAGVTILNVAAGTAVDPCISNGAPVIPHPTGHTVALVVTNSVAPGIQQPVLLPNDAEIGDVVEVYRAVATTVGNCSPVALFPPVGSSFGPGFPTNNGTSSNLFINADNVICRKIDATTWRLIRGQ